MKHCVSGGFTLTLFAVGEEWELNQLYKKCLKVYSCWCASRGLPILEWRLTFNLKHISLQYILRRLLRYSWEIKSNILRDCTPSFSREEVNKPSIMPTATCSLNVKDNISKNSTVFP